MSAVQLSGSSKILVGYLHIESSVLVHRDRATYNSSLQTAVNYTVASPADAPTSLTYGPSFFSLANGLKGDVTIGLNRQLNNQANSLSAGARAKSSVNRLLALELGNEPDRLCLDFS